MQNVSTNVLKKELDFYHKNKEQYLKTHKDKFLLIKEEELVGAFDSQEEAYKVGVEKFGSEAFLIRQVVSEEQTASIPALTVGVINARL